MKSYPVKSSLKPDSRILQQKGRRNPIQSQKGVDAESNRLLNEGQIQKMKVMEDGLFNQAKVFRVENDFSVKIALDGCALNQAIDKDKYQKPNLDILLDMVAEKLASEEGEAWFSSVDLTFAYSQVPLHQLTAEQCKFQIIGGQSTGTGRFVTGVHGLTVIPTEFQKVMDILLDKFRDFV